VIRAVAIPVQLAGDFRVNAIAEGTAPTPSDKASVYVRLSEEGDVQLFAQAEFTPIVARARRGANRFRRAAGAAREYRKIRSRRAAVDIRRHRQDHDLARSGDARGARTDAAAFSKPLTLSGNVNTIVNATNVRMMNVEVQIWDHDTISPDDQLGEGPKFYQCNGLSRGYVSARRQLPRSGRESAKSLS
jgi:hypothetical protein